jgi:hypothetical protein
MVKWPEHGFLDDDAEGKNVLYWKASTLWKLSETMEIEHVPLDSFDWTNENFQCGNLSNPPLWRDIGDHAKRIMNADLQYPIVINSKGHVMDGMHRILKAYVFGLPTVKAVRFKEDPPRDMIVPIEDAEER